MYSWTDTQQADHEVSMRQGGVIIGKLGRDQRSGARDQKRNELGAWWVAFETAGGLTRKDWGSGIRKRAAAGSARGNKVGSPGPGSDDRPNGGP
jgi:hypothetical protein